MVEIKEIPFNQTMLKKAAGEDEIEYYNINSVTKTEVERWNLK